jgi:hypothetical protein
LLTFSLKKEQIISQLLQRVQSVVNLENFFFPGAGVPLSQSIYVEAEQTGKRVFPKVGETAHIALGLGVFFFIFPHL